MNQISPELALVDPELAAEARAALPEPAPIKRPPSVEQPAPVEAPAQVERPARRSRRRPRRVVAVVGALVLAAAVAAVALMRDEPQPAARSAQPAAAPAQEPEKSAPVARPLTPPTPKPLPPTGAHRVYTWAPTEGAFYYRVEILRNGELFHAAETADPSLRLPATLRLPPGTYRWSVRPATVGPAGVALQRAILTRTFEVGGG